MKTIRCTKCDTDIRSCNYKKHHEKCNGIYKPFVKALSCIHCGIELNVFTNANRANHIRWCDKNPLRNTYKSCSGKQLHTPEANAKRRLSIKQSHLDGKYKDAASKGIETRRKNGKMFHTEESKNKIRIKALNSPHRRLKKNTVEYNGITLDSSWELTLAKRLDSLDIKWNRPDPLRWTDDNGDEHHYFPDFYLPDYNLYLDPKNPEAVRKQKRKIEILMIQYPNIKILYTLNECQNFSIDKL